MQSQHSKEKERFFGLFFIILGLGWLMKKLGVEYFPDWLLSWPSALILLGLFFAIKHGFTKLAPFVLMGVGGLFLARNYFDLDINIGTFLLPSIIILIGLVILLKPKKHSKKCSTEEEIIEDQDRLSKLKISSVFCGSKKRILSKDFEGGQLSAVFGGTELNLSQADFQGEKVLDISIVFGGIKMIIPSNWEVKSNLSLIAAGIEDKRTMMSMEHTPEKTLILDGSVVFGGIEIVSH